MRRWNLTYFNGELERPGFNIRQELIWDQPGPNKQIKGKQMTSVWLDVWRDQCISGQEMDDLHSLVDVKGIQWYLSAEKGARHPILFLERLFSFNKFNHCGKQGRGRVCGAAKVVVAVLFRQRLYNPYWSFCFFMVRVALMVLMRHFEAVLIVSGPLLS